MGPYQFPNVLRIERDEGSNLHPGQNHHAVAGGYAVGTIRKVLRSTHPLPRGGSDPVQEQVDKPINTD